MTETNVRYVQAEDVLPISSTPVTTRAILQAHNDEVWFVEWSPSGAYLAGGSKDGKAIVWKNEPGTDDFVPLHILEHPHGVTCLAWSSDESILVIGAESIIKMWNVKMGECLKTIERHTETITSIQRLPAGSGFVSAGLDRQIIFWNANLEFEKCWDHNTMRATDLAVSPDASRFVMIGMNPPVSSSKNPLPECCSSMQIYNLTTEGLTSTTHFSNDVTGVKISSDSVHGLINEPGKIRLFDLRVGQTIKTYPGHKQTQHVVRSSYGGENEEFVLSGSEDGKVYIWDSQTTSLLHALPGHGAGTVNMVSWKPYSKDTFASCSDDHTIRIWKMEGLSTIEPDLPKEDQASWVIVESWDFAD